MKFYSKKRIIISITLSIVIFFLVGSINESTYAGIFGASITLAILLPKIWWNFLLDRVRELSRAMKDE